MIGGHGGVHGLHENGQDIVHVGINRHQPEFGPAGAGHHDL
jgi:hypothetical protein